MVTESHICTACQGIYDGPRSARGTCPRCESGGNERPTAPTSKQRAIWHRANVVEVPDIPEMIDHPGDTVSRFVAVSDGFRMGTARWHYPTKSWCHKGKYDGNVLFWSLVPSWESTPDETAGDDARDAARYRFLRQPCNAIVYAKDRNAWGKNASGHVRYDTAEQLDAAVDAARGAEEQLCNCGEFCNKSLGQPHAGTCRRLKQGLPVNGSDQ